MNYNRLYTEGKIVNGINGFQGKYRCLSNFYKLNTPMKVYLPIYSENQKEYSFDNVESAFQACKASSIEDVDKMISKCKTAGQFKRYGRRMALRKDWETIKVNAMLDLLIKKCFCCRKFINTLVSIPDDMVIVEMNSWGDKYWGVSNKDFQGENILGRLLSNLRKDLIEGRI